MQPAPVKLFTVRFDGWKYASMSAPEMVNVPTVSFWRGTFTFWPVVSVVIFLVVLSPIVGLVLTAFSTNTDTWQHLLNTVLPKALSITVLLMIGVSTLSILVGAGTAWLVTLYRFPGQQVFKWLLVVLA